jgi:hypothetical protein
VGLHGLESLIPLVSALPLGNPKEVGAAFRGATPQQLQALSDPMTRMLACEPNERALQRHVSVALETLSFMDLVGTRDRFAVFGRTLQGLLSRDIFDVQKLAISESADVLANSLSQIKIVNEFLENDIVLYAWVEQAIGYGVQLAAN